MKTLVTGGAGFIGSHLSEKLLAHGHSVRVIDNLAGGRLENITHLMDQSGFEFHQADITDSLHIIPLFEGIEWVFHLAALADIVPSIENPLRYHHANVNGTVSVLEASRAAGVKRFIYAASSSCYGIADQIPTSETAPIRPMYPYALTKFIGEQYVFHWQQTYGLPCVSLRLFNVYGQRHRTTGSYGAVFGVFLAQKLAGKPFTIVGDGAQTRDFTYVTDVVDAFIALAQSDCRGELFNVGSGDTISINRLTQLLGGDCIHIPKRPGEPDATFADIEKITRMTAWRPRVAFEQGVTRMLEHMDLWKDAPVWTEQSIAKATEKWFHYLGEKDRRQ